MGCDPSILNVDRRENNISDGFHCHLKPRRTTAVKLSNLNLWDNIVGFFRLRLFNWCDYFPCAGPESPQLHQDRRGLRVPGKHQPLPPLDPGVSSPDGVAHQPRGQAPDEEHLVPLGQKRHHRLDQRPEQPNKSMSFFMKRFKLGSFEAVFVDKGHKLSFCSSTLFKFDFVSWPFIPPTPSRSLSIGVLQTVELLKLQYHFNVME